MNTMRVFSQIIILTAALAMLERPIYAQDRDENFNLLDDFEENKNSFRRDSTSLPEISNDGGQVVVYSSPQKSYKVFAVQLFGQPGKLHYLFVTDRNANLKLTKQLEYEYRQPGEKKTAYEPVKKTTFYSFGDKSFKVYNADRTLIKDKDADKQEKIEKLFERVKER